MTCTLTDIDTLLPHFIPKGIIKIEDLDEIKAKPKLSDHVHQLLKYIEGPLRIRNAESFYALLDVMSTHGNLCTKKLAAIMKGTFAHTVCTVCVCCTCIQTFSTCAVKH